MQMQTHLVHSGSRRQPSPAQQPRARRAFAKLQLIIIAALVGILVTLAGVCVASGLKLRREAKIRENLQTLWVTANQYFLDTEKEEVALGDLAKYKADGVVPVTRLTDSAVAGEDYATVNGGTIKRDDKRLVVDYGKGGADRRVVYETTRVRPKK